MQHAEELGVGRLLTGGVKARGAKPSLVALPFAGTAGGVAQRGGAADALLIDPAVVNAAGIGGLQRFAGAVRIENLNFVEAL